MTAAQTTPQATSSTLYFGPWYRRSPFFEKTLEAGCSAYDIYNHMYLPGYYADPIEEYWALLNERHGLGRLGRADRRDHRPRRFGLHEPADLPRPHEVRRRPGQVRAHHRRRRRHRQRPRPAAGRGEPLVARARRQRRRPVRARRGRELGPGRQGPRARGLPDPGPGPEVEGRHAHALRRRDPRHQVLLDADDRARRHPGRHQPDRLDGRGRLRDLPARPVARRRPLGPRLRGRQAVRHPADRAGARRAASRPASSTTART